MTWNGPKRRGRSSMRAWMNRPPLFRYALAAAVSRGLTTAMVCPWQASHIAYASSSGLSAPTKSTFRRQERGATERAHGLGIFARTVIGSLDGVDIRIPDYGPSIGL